MSISNEILALEKEVAELVERRKSIKRGDPQYTILTEEIEDKEQQLLHMSDDYSINYNNE